MPLGWRTCQWIIAKSSCTSLSSCVILCIDVLLLLTSILLGLLLLRLQLSAEGLHKELIIWVAQSNQGSRINFGHILINQIRILWPTYSHEIICQPLFLPFALHIRSLTLVVLPRELHALPWCFWLWLPSRWTRVIISRHGVLPSSLERLAGVTLSSQLGRWSLTTHATVSIGYWIDIRWWLNGSVLMGWIGAWLWSHVALHALGRWSSIWHILLLSLLLLILNHVWTCAHKIRNASGIFRKSIVVQITVSLFLTGCLSCLRKCRIRSIVLLSWILLLGIRLLVWIIRTTLGRMRRKLMILRCTSHV